MVCLKSLLSRFSVLVNYTMQSSNHFSTSSCFPRFLWSRFSGSMFFRAQCFRVQVFLGQGFSGSRFSDPRFFRVQVFRPQVFQGPGPGFRSSLFIEHTSVLLGFYTLQSIDHKHSPGGVLKKSFIKNYAKSTGNMPESLPESLY